MLYILFLVLVLLPTLSHGVTHVAIHATDVEIGIWQTRKVSGPYKEEWDTLLGRANTFVASGEARWPGNTSGGCFTAAQYSLAPGRTKDAGLRDAAFVYMLEGGASRLTAVRNALIAQTAVAGSNFANATLWCPTTAEFHGYGDNISPWLRRMAYAYSYVKPGLSAADRATIETWLRNAGLHFASNIHNVVKKRWPQRLNDIYTGGCQFGCAGTPGLTHFGGYPVYNFHEAWQNKGTSMAAFVAVAGVLTNDASLKSQASRYVQEWIKWGSYPNGTIHDQYRWGSGAPTQTLTPQHGYLYAGESLGSILTAVEVLARDGYVNLYEYSTSIGLLGTEGGPKSLRTVMQHYAGLTNGTVSAYASTTATTNAALRIHRSGPDMERIEFVVLATGNLYYQDPAVVTAYNTTLPGSWATSGCDMKGGDWCTFPGVRFMWGGLEGISMPYGGGPVATEPDYTSNLMMHLKFDEGTLTTAQDSTANNHDGTLSSGATWGPAKMGSSAVVLDGTISGAVTVTGELGTPAAVTLAAWVKVSAFPTPTADLISIGDSVILRATATTIRGQYYTGATWTSLEATRTLGTTDWHHLALVVQAGTQQLYLDGAPVASGSNGAPIVYTGLGSNTILGGHGNGNTTNFRFQGQLDDVRVYSRVLSATDIAGLAALGFP